MDYVPLLCRSGYSFLQAASLPEEYVEAAARSGLSAVGITDRDGVYGIIRAHVTARNHGIRSLCGAELTRADGPPLHLMPTSLQGYGNLCELISEGRASATKGSSRLETSRILAMSRDLLLIHCHMDQEESPSNLKEAFGDRFYAGLSRYQTFRDVGRIEKMLEVAARLDLPKVVAHPTRFHHPSRKALADTMTAIRFGKTLDQAGALLMPNASLTLLDTKGVERIYGQWPDAIKNTIKVAERIEFSLNQIRYSYPSEVVPEGHDSDSWLFQLCRKMGAWRYPAGVPAEVRRQLEVELDFIRELGYADYFLTMHDIVSRAREKGILCQGRGSAANSAVCFVLGITSVDPATSSLLFERFLSRERKEPPDIDVDFEHERREEVIQDIYQRYGSDRAAMIATFIRYRRRSAARDVGKVLGLAQSQVDRLSRVMHQFRREDAGFPEILKAAGLDPDHRRIQTMMALVEELRGFPRHLSIHVGGFLITDVPVRRLVPVEPARMDGRTVIQWDKEDIEDAALLKIDILSLGMLTAIRKSLTLVSSHHQIRLDLATIPADDGPTYQMIQAADTVGVFQIESRAQMSMLARLKPRCFYDLVVEVAIVRPGPIQGGMIHPYLRRRRGLEPITYPIPELEPVLSRTFGVPLFQEQVMKLAVVAGGFTPGEADLLRRAMGVPRVNRPLEPLLEKLITQMEARGINREYANQIADQIRGFGEYGFPESHAASFALLAYASSYLKCHFPEAFAAALINSQPMGFYSPHSIIYDAVRHGVEVRPVSINRSCWDCTLEPGDRSGTFALRLGLRLLKGLNLQWTRTMEEERTRGGFFSSLDLLVSRTAAPSHILLKLAVSGALDELYCTSPDRSSRSRGEMTLIQARTLAIWSAHSYWSRSNSLFDLTRREAGVPRLPGMTVLERMVSEHEQAGTCVDTHPMELLRPWLARHRFLDSAAVNGAGSGQIVRTAGLVIIRQRPPTAAGMMFITLEDEKGFINLVIPPPVRVRYREILMGHPVLAVRGVVERDKDAVSLKLRDASALEMADEPIPIRSRDFH